MFEKWELSYYPSEKDKNRWRLKMKITDEEVESLLSKMNVNVGRPYVIMKSEYNWGAYIYNLSSEDRKSIVRILKDTCPEGSIIIDGVELNIEEELGEKQPLPEMAGAPEQDISVETASAQQLTQEIAEAPPVESGQAIESASEPPPESLSEPRQVIVSPVKAEVEEEKIWSIELNPKYVFEEFIIGPNNRFTHAAAMAVAENPGKIYNPFFIYGGVGLGKTHLLQSIGHHIHKKSPGAKVYYITSEKFIGEVIDSIGQGTLNQFRERYRKMDALLVDDIQFFAESESTQEEFFHTFNILHQNGKQIVLTSDRPPKQLTTLEDRLRSRFEWGLIADIKPPTLETRVAILKKKGETEHLFLDSNMLLYVAGKLKSNIRELEGFLKRINAYASILGREIDMELIKELMTELLPEEEVEEVKETKVKPPKKPAPEPEPQVYRQQPDISVQEEVTPPSVYTQPTAPVVQIQKEVVGGDVKYRSIEVAFFFPEGKLKELSKVKEKFSNVIKKHNLKFHMVSVLDRSYDPNIKINYNMFPELCKTNKVDIAIVIGPSPDAHLGGEEFQSLLLPTMENEKISLQFIPWYELDKDYRYLNLALDITLTSHRGATW